MTQHRKPVCIVGVADYMFALCDDGTVWQVQLGQTAWDRVQDIPDGRKAVSICVNQCDGADNVWAVCDDGTIWRRHPGALVAGWTTNWAGFQDVPAIETLEAERSPFRETEQPGNAA